MVKKKLIEGGGYVKGKHTNPEVRKKYKLTKKRVPYGVRGKYKKQDPAKRKKSKKQDPALRKKQDPSKRKTYTSLKRKRREA
jgi:hypothetical protein